MPRPTPRLNSGRINPQASAKVPSTTQRWFANGASSFRRRHQAGIWSIVARVMPSRSNSPPLDMVSIPETIWGGVYGEIHITAVRNMAEAIISQRCNGGGFASAERILECWLHNSVGVRASKGNKHNTTKKESALEAEAGSHPHHSKNALTSTQRKVVYPSIGVVSPGFHTKPHPSTRCLP
jgi:hypothetical protein